jgi:predicted Zn-dependent protease
MNSMKITLFKYMSLCLSVVFLGACAGPGYGPIVEDLSVQARASQRISLATNNVLGNETNPSATDTQPRKPVELEKPKPYVVPKAKVTITPQSSPSKVVVAPTEKDIAVVIKQEEALPPSDQAVVEQLLSNADSLKGQGKMTEAVIQLQRAQRIAPREPKVYARLSALQLSLGEAARAEQLALKGLTLVPNKKRYQYYFWKLIAASRSHLGNSKGEAEAIIQADKYK